MSLIHDVRQEWSDPVVLEKDDIGFEQSGRSVAAITRALTNRTCDEPTRCTSPVWTTRSNFGCSSSDSSPSSTRATDSARASRRARS